MDDTLPAKKDNRLLRRIFEVRRGPQQGIIFFSTRHHSRLDRLSQLCIFRNSLLLNEFEDEPFDSFANQMCLMSCLNYSERLSSKSVSEKMLIDQLI